MDCTNQKQGIMAAGSQSIYFYNSTSIDKSKQCDLPIFSDSTSPESKSVSYTETKFGTDANAHFKLNFIY